MYYYCILLQLKRSKSTPLTPSLSDSLNEFQCVVTVRVSLYRVGSGDEKVGGGSEVGIEFRPVSFTVNSTGNDLLK